MRLLTALVAPLTLALLLAPTSTRASCATMPTLCNLPVTSTVEQPDLDEAIDVVFVGDGFTDATTWSNAAANAIATFKAQTATGLYGTVPGLYNFHVVRVLSATTDVSNTDLNDTALGMRVSGSFITADPSRVNTAALNAPDVDVVVAIASAPGRANANYPVRLASGGSMRLGIDPSPISHEMGHALINLADEYVESGLCSSASELLALRERNVTADNQCRKFATTSGAGCVEGARYCATGMFRSASGCLMSSSGNSATCPACRRAVRETLLEKLTGLDHAEPWAVIAAPAAGATVTGTVSLSALTWDDGFRPTRVAFVVDGNFVGSVDTSTGNATWSVDTTRWVDGPHTLVAYPDDSAGHAGRSVPVTFTTANHAAGALTLALTQPLSGAAVNGKTFVAGQATGGLPMWLALLVDGTPVTLVTDDANLNTLWDTSGVPLGAHTLQLQAADRQLNVVNSAPVSVTVSAPPDGGSGGGTQGNGIFISSPFAWARVGPYFLLRYNLLGQGATTPDLWVDGRRVVPSPLPMSTSGSGPEGGSESVVLDARGWALGPHFLQVRTASAASTPVPVVRVAPGSAPTALLVSPLSGAFVRGAVAVSAVAYDDVSIQGLSLKVDGSAVATATGSPATLTWATTAAQDGRHTLQIDAVDGVGNHGLSEEVSVTVDNTPPTVAISSPLSGTVPAKLSAVLVLAQDSAMERVELLVDGTVTARAPAGARAVSFPMVLSPGAHTLTARGFDRAGNSATSAPVVVNAQDCVASACNDSNACTADSCGSSGQCLFVRTANCCTAMADCDDGDACTTDACNGSVCTHTAVSGCCNYGGQCVDNDSCTTDRCSGPGGTCSHASNGCCASAADCNDGNSCTADTCQGAPSGFCTHDWNGTCCRNNADCDDQNSCTTESCNQGACVVTQVAGCCNTSADCNDNVACTFDVCQQGRCIFPRDPNCCATAADCPTGNPCTTAACNSGRCSFSTDAGCCSFDFECDDRASCTVDVCLSGTCEHRMSCCSAAAQCDDGRACTADSCDLDAGACVFAPVPRCCSSVRDCDDLDFCTDDSCAQSQCVSTPIAGCCHAEAECDDGNVCTTDSCSNTTCTHSAIAGCCTTAGQCDDQDACTTDSCEQNRCQHLAGCCANDAACDDGNVCTADRCVMGACQRAAISGCCATTADCGLGQECVATRCVLPDGGPGAGGGTSGSGGGSGGSGGAGGMRPPPVTGTCGCDASGALPLVLAVAMALSRRGRSRRQPSGPPG